MKQLATDLAQKNIYTALRKNSEGRMYGITFVDNQSNCVFNGSDLGKGFSAGALQSRLTASMNESTILESEKTTVSSSPHLCMEINQQKQQEKSVSDSFKHENLLDVLLSAKEQFGNTPFQLLQKKKKQRKKTTLFKF